jgi:hypothetical protein
MPVFSLLLIELGRFMLLFHHSIIPVGNMQNGRVGIPYYQQVAEFPEVLPVI